MGTRLLLLNTDKITNPALLEAVVFLFCQLFLTCPLDVYLLGWHFWTWITCILLAPMSHFPVDLGSVSSTCNVILFASISLPHRPIPAAAGWMGNPSIPVQSGLASESTFAIQSFLISPAS